MKALPIKLYIWLSRALFALLGLAVFIFAAAVLALRYWILPDIGRYRDDIAHAISDAAHQRVTIGTIAANWDGLRPHLSLGQVIVFNQQGQPALTLDRVENTLSWWTLVTGEVRFHAIELKRPKLNVRREPDGLIYVSDVAVNRPGATSGFADWLLHQESLIVSHAEVEWRDNLRQAPPLVLTDVGFRLENRGSHHRFGLVARPPATLASQLDIRGDLRGKSLQDLTHWRGTLYANLGYTDIAAWRTWVDFPYPLRRGTGGMQAWVDVDAGHPVALTADVRLAGVKTRLGKSLPELELARLTGRFAWRELPRGFQIETKHLSVEGPERIRFPSASVFVKYQAGDTGHAELGEVRADSVALQPIVQITEYLPLSAHQREIIHGVDPRGQIKSATLKWTGPLESPQTYQAKASVVDLGMNAYNKLPGFQNVSGTLDADDKGGHVALTGRYSAFDMPLVFRYPVGFDTLGANASWKIRGGRANVSIANLSFANSDVAGQVSGTYQSEPGVPGTIDLIGGLTRANAGAVYLYLPRIVGEDTYDWLRDSLAGGSASDVRLKLKGDLRHFPFADERGEIFQVTGKVQGVTLHYAPGWPEIDNISAALDFHGQRMDIDAQSGTIYSVRLGKVRLSLPDLAHHDETLEVQGDAQGPTQDIVQFLANSPIADRVGQYSESLTVQGGGRLALRMQIPLRHAVDTRVAGSYQFFNNTLHLDPSFPALEQLNGRLDFTQTSVSMPKLTAQVLGGPANIAMNTQRDGSLRFTASGRLTADALRLAYPGPFTSALGGSGDWSLGIGMRGKLANATFISDLRGISSSLPFPLEKAAPDPLLLRVERRMADTQKDQLAISVGKVLSVQLRRELVDGVMQVKRGTVRFNGLAPEPVHDGVWVDGELSRLDLDAWRALSAAKEDTLGLPLSGIHLNLATLDFIGRRFNDFQINAWRQADVWQATIDSQEMAGDASWRSSDGGKLTARLKRLVFPDKAPARGVAPAGGRDIDLPELDVVVDDLQIKKLNLGRLDLAATKQGADWHIDRLRVTNPDATLTASGTWQSWLAQPASKLDLDLEVKDIGKFLARMGQPDRIKRGTAKLKGDLSWRGGPQEFNVPSLSGNLQLEAHSGQFLKMDPGVGKLLGLLSLQSLPRRLTLDFRDVFSEGFAFDNIAGSAVVNNGVLSSKNFIMQGPAAVVNISGVTDLVKETQSLHVQVVPGVGEGVAVAGAFLGGPVVGVTAFLLQKLLKNPVGQIVSHEYEVTGTWDNPQVTKVSKRAAEEKP